MKKSLKFSLLALVMAGAVACGDDDADDQPQTNAELLVGEWNATTEESYTYDANDSLVEADTIHYPAGFATFTFGDDGSFEYLISDLDTSNGTYVLDGTALSIFTEDTVEYEMTSIDEENLVLESEDEEGAGVHRGRYAFERK